MKLKVAQLKSSIMLLIFGISFFVTGSAWAQTPSIESQQAMLIYKLASNGKWVIESKDSKFIIGIYADREKFNFMNEFFSDKRVNDKTTVIKLVNNRTEARKVNVLYVPQEQNEQLIEDDIKVGGPNILLINEAKNGLYRASYDQKQDYIVFSVKDEDVFDKDLTLSTLYDFIDAEGEELFSDTKTKEQEAQELLELNSQQSRELIAENNKQKKELKALQNRLKRQQSSLNQLNITLAASKEDSKNYSDSLKKETKRLNVAYQANAENLKNIEAKEKELDDLKAKLKMTSEGVDSEKINSQTKAIVELTEQLENQIKLTKKAEANSSGTSDSFQLLFYIMSALSVIALLIAYLMWKKSKDTSDKPTKTVSSGSDKLLPIREGQLIKAENFSAFGYIATDTTYAVGSQLSEFLEQLESGGETKNIATLKPIVNLLETFNVIAADQDDTDVQDFDLVAYTQKMMMLYDFEFSQSDIVYSYSGETELTIKSVPSYIALVLLHLLNNSLKHAFNNNGNGKIALKVEKGEQGGAKLTYSDEGKGMNKATLAKVFDPFFTTCGDRGYTGAGMCTTYNLIKKKLKGDIVIESTEGKGTTVTITLP